MQTSNGQHTGQHTGMQLRNDHPIDQPTYRCRQMASLLTSTLLSNFAMTTPLASTLADADVKWPDMQFRNDHPIGQHTCRCRCQTASTLACTLVCNYAMTTALASTHPTGHHTRRCRLQTASTLAGALVCNFAMTTPLASTLADADAKWPAH